MADIKTIKCSCSNIIIMQLFHELKQRYPSVPDYIVSKVMQENYHNKDACEKVLDKGNPSYLQSYPGAIIPRSTKDNLSKTSICFHCRNSNTSAKGGSDMVDRIGCSVTENTIDYIGKSKVKKTFYLSNENCTYMRYTPGNAAKDKASINEKCIKCKNQFKEQTLVSVDVLKQNSASEIMYDDKEKCNKKSEEYKSFEIAENFSEDNSIEPDLKIILPPQFKTRLYTSNSDDLSKLITNRNNKTKTIFSKKSDCFNFQKLNSQEKARNIRWNNKEEIVNEQKKNDSFSRRLSVYNHQVAVQYSMKSGLMNRGDHQRSFTTVHLNIRPPSSQPQTPIEIDSEKNLTFTSWVFDAKNGVESKFQIMIGPGSGDDANSSFQICSSSPETPFSSFGTSHCPSRILPDFYNHGDRLKATLENQMEQKNRLARELRKEQDRLHNMRIEVKLLKAYITKKPKPHHFLKLKTEIERLRAECEKLTAAINFYSDYQNILSLGETDKEFYQNIYTGQKLPKEKNWSCQLCTFRNHPLLNVCEECEMPRILLNGTVMDVSSRMPNIVVKTSKSLNLEGKTSTSNSFLTAPIEEP